MLDARRRAMLAELGVQLPAPLRAAPAPEPPSGAAEAPAPQAGSAVALGPADSAPTAGRPAPADPVRLPAAPAAPATPAAPAAGAAPGLDPHLVPAGTRPTGAAGAQVQAPIALARGPVATMDWPALVEAAAGCRACGLCAQRRQAVLEAGPRDADWMVVGEAPGEQEDREGLPFVGKSGQLLDRMLAAIGVSRQGRGRAGAPAAAPQHEGVYIANTLKCRPPGNRNPAPEELAACAPFLQRQLELVQPRVLLLMGRFAVQSLLGSEAPLGRLRGQVHQVLGRPAIVSYHPSYLLRSPMEKAKAWDDLCLARATLDSLRAADGG